MTLSVFPSSQVSFPFSRSMTKRSPVPAVKARSFCVTPRRLRASRITLPISSGVYFNRASKTFPYGNIIAVWRQMATKCSRAGIHSRPAKKVQPNMPVREVRWMGSTDFGERWWRHRARAAQRAGVSRGAVARELPFIRHSAEALESILPNRRFRKNAPAPHARRFQPKHRLSRPVCLRMLSVQRASRLALASRSIPRRSPPRGVRRCGATGKTSAIAAQAGWPQANSI